jgi:hypothetical protein
MVSDDLSAFIPNHAVRRTALSREQTCEHSFICDNTPLHAHCQEEKENIFPENVEKRHLLCTDAALEELLLLYKLITP